MLWASWLERTSSLGTTSWYQRLWSHDKERFRGGQLREHAWFWEEVLLPASGLSAVLQARVLGWITTAVSVQEFARHFVGTFARTAYNCALPPPFAHRNHPVETAEERHFVNTEVEKWVQYGAVRDVAVAPRCCLPVGVAHGKKLRLLDAITSDGVQMPAAVPEGH
jgi:hypothetical protein